MGKILLRPALLSFLLVLVTSVHGADTPAPAALKVPPEVLAKAGISPAKLASIQEAAARGDPDARETMAMLQKITALSAGAATADPGRDSVSQGRDAQSRYVDVFGKLFDSGVGTPAAERWAGLLEPKPMGRAALFAPMGESGLFPTGEPGSPMRLTAVANGRPWPVIRVAGTYPVVLQEKKEKRIRNEPVYSTERGDHFAPDWVDVKDLEVSGVKITTNENITGTAYCAMTLTARADLKGAFIAVLVFDADFILRGQEAPHTTYRVHDLPDLPKGKPVALEFTCSAVYGRGLRYYVPLIFAKGGTEIPTNYAGQVKFYFATLEKNLHTAALRDYRAKNNGDHDAELFQRVNPIMPELAVAFAKVPATATLSIDESGHVRAVEINTPLDRVRTKALDDALRSWLFLPKLKAGQPAPDRVKINLEL